MMNVLILSAGTRNKIVQYFKRECEGSVIATDYDRLAPAIYEADKYYTVPRITEPGYIDLILSICKKERIDGVLSLIDPELSILAANKDSFESLGAHIIGSSFDLCELALDKYDMYCWLEQNGFNCARSWKDIDAFYSAVSSGDVDYPVFVKPTRGSASMSISKANDKMAVDFLCSCSKKLMVQEYLDGEEIGADVYIDMISGEVVSIFTKRKIKMRAGETDKAVSFKNKSLFEYIERFVLKAGYKGQIDIDIFNINGQFYISEVNPRFGGGYPHAHESGCNHIKLIYNNLKGKVNEKEIGHYDEGIYMMKYNDVSIITE